jgi:hypothetical protein
MVDQLTSFLFTAGMPQPPCANPDLQAQARDLLETPARLRTSWAETRRQLEEDGYEAAEFAVLCRVRLNLLDNCAALLEMSARLPDHVRPPADEVRAALAEVEAQQKEIRRLHELATRKPPPFDLAALRAAQQKHAGTPAVEVGELMNHIAD